MVEADYYQNESNIAFEPAQWMVKITIGRNNKIR